MYAPIEIEHWRHAIFFWIVSFFLHFLLKWLRHNLKLLPMTLRCSNLASQTFKIKGYESTASLVTYIFQNQNHEKDTCKHNYNSDTFLNGLWSCADLGTDTHVRNVSKRDWTMCLLYVNHSKSNSQHILGGTYMTI